MPRRPIRKPAVVGTGAYPFWFVHFLNLETREKIMSEFSIPSSADFGMVQCIHRFGGKDRKDGFLLVRVLRHKVKLILKRYPKREGFVLFKQTEPHTPPRQTTKR